MTNDGPFYCAACLAVVELHLDESWCDNCGRSIEAESDVLDHDEWATRKHAGDVAWSDAVRDGLIQEPGKP